MTKETLQGCKQRDRELDELAANGQDIAPKAQVNMNHFAKMQFLNWMPIEVITWKTPGIYI